MSDFDIQNLCKANNKLLSQRPVETKKILIKIVTWDKKFAKFDAKFIIMWIQLWK